MWKAVIFIGSFAVLAASLAAITSPDPDQPTNPDAMPRYACQQFILRHLQAPSTADVSQYFAWPVEQRGDVYVVAATVDAENVFGAMLRRTMICEVRTEDGEWYLESLTEG